MEFSSCLKFENNSSTSEVNGKALRLGDPHKIKGTLHGYCHGNMVPQCHFPVGFGFLYSQQMVHGCDAIIKDGWGWDTEGIIIARIYWPTYKVMTIRMGWQIKYIPNSHVWKIAMAQWLYLKMEGAQRRSCLWDTGAQVWFYGCVCAGHFCRKWNHFRRWFFIPPFGENISAEDPHLLWLRFSLTEGICSSYTPL